MCSRFVRALWSHAFFAAAVYAAGSARYALTSAQVHTHLSVDCVSNRNVQDVCARVPRLPTCTLPDWAGMRCPLQSTLACQHYLLVDARCTCMPSLHAYPDVWLTAGSAMVPNLLGPQCALQWAFSRCVRSLSSVRQGTPDGPP
jgi:hypothetical protein